MKKLNSNFLLSTIIVIAGLLLYGCKCGSCQKQEETEVPLVVLEKANKFIKNKTGDDFFTKYITPDFVLTKNLKPGYYMVYRFINSDKDIDTKINFVVDSLGNLDTTKEVVGIPECIQKPEECEFSISRSQAESIAKQNNLAKGIKDWKIGLIWSSKFQKYVWHVLSVKEEFVNGDQYRGSGEEMIIDPSSGNMMDRHNWKVN